MHLKKYWCVIAREHSDRSNPVESSGGLPRPFGARNDRASESGVTVVAAILAVLLLGAIGSGMAYFIASGQQTRIQQVTSDQSFYSNHAGMEYALGKILQEGSVATSFTKKFVSETVTVTRSGGLLTVASTKKNARDLHSITDPNPAPSVDCLDVNTGGAIMGTNTRLTGITFSRNVAFSGTVSITNMTGTNWSANNGELLTAVEMDNAPTEFSGSGASGAAFVFSAPFTFSDALTHNLTYVQWGSVMTNKSINLIFNYTCSGTPKTKTVAVSTASQAQSFSFGLGGCRLELTAGIWKQLTGCTVTNTGSNSITLTSLTMSWTPLSPSRDLKQLKIEAVSVANGTISSGQAVSLSPQYTINGGTTHNITQFLFSDEMMSKNYTMIWGFEDGSTANVSMPLFAANQGVCFTINTGASYIYESGSVHQIQGVTVEDTCGQDVGIVGMTVSWSGNPSLKVKSVSMDDVDTTRVQNPPGGASSGTLIDFGNNDYYYLESIGAKALNYLDFNAIVPTGTAFTVTFNMSDGTTSSATFTPQTESGCLTVNTTGAYISGSDLLGMTVTNTCSQTVTWTQASVSWSGTSRTLSQIVVDGTTYFSGSGNKGATVNINPDITFTASQTRAITRLRFNNTMANRWISLQFIMMDTSTKTVTVSHANCLSVPTGGSSIGGTGYVDLLGVTVTNGCTAYAISWTTTTVSWTPTSPSRSMTSIVANGSSIWTGTASSGTNVNNTNVALSASQSKPIDRFRFNGDMRGRTFTIIFTMADTSTFTTSAFTPP